MLLWAILSFTSTRAAMFLTGYFFPLEQAESAIIALNCSGMLLGTQSIRFGPCTGDFSPLPLGYRNTNQIQFDHVGYPHHNVRVSPSKTPVRPRVERPISS